MLTLHPQTHHDRRGSSSSTSLSGCASDSHLSAAAATSSFYTSSSMARHKPSSAAKSASKRSAADEKVVANALETARETEEGAHDPEVRKILEDALARIWDKIQAQPDSYVMSRTEMSVFTYYQYSFAGNELAVAARKRYWDHMHG